MVDPSLVSGMNEFVLLSVLRYHRGLPVYETQQRAKHWKQIMSPLAEDRVVGILGLGQLGARCAQSLSALGFKVRGWSRSPHELEGIATFHGRSELKQFLQGCEILVCLLPLTPDTRDLLNKDLFEELPAGAFVINASRGDVLVEKDLLAALESGHLGGATLDVFRQEPLPPTHPFWDHPKVTVIPHAAALTQPKTAARTVADNIARDQAGQPLLNAVDLATGY
jgi:glyoxylate/hydroxypyruvate reductase A